MLRSDPGRFANWIGVGPSRPGLLRQAEKYGARVALFGRKIYFSEDSVLMIAAMRQVIEERLSSQEGTKAYHASLEKAGIKPFRAPTDDLELTELLLGKHTD